MAGTASGLLHYDGKAWKQSTNVFPDPTRLDLRAVFSSKKHNLVTVAGVRNSWGSSGRQVLLYNYNRKLDAWLGPVVLYKGSYNSPADILDIGGQDYNDIWLVGQKQVASSGSNALKGWVLTLK